MRKRFAALCTLSLLLVFGGRVNAQPDKPAAKPEAGVSLTVYNSDLGVVKDRRVLDFAKGTSELRFGEVAKQIDATSVRFKSLDAPDDVSILEQNYEYDLVNAHKLLEKFLDKEITVFLKDGNLHAGTLMSFDHAQIVLKDKKGGLTMIARNDNVKDIQFPKLPEGLIVKPTLMWKVHSDKGGKQLSQVTYMTGGIGWRADYTVVTNEDDTQIDLGGWVTVTNNSGATYKDAKLKLIAGDIHRAQQPRPQWRGRAMAEAAGAPGFEEKSFFEYHLYTLPRPATVKENQVKQIELLHSNNVPVEKRFIFDHQKNQKKVMVNLEFENSKKNRVGMALPKGRVRVYKRDTDGSLELLGEDDIDHTPTNEKVRIHVGDAFDLTPEYTKTNFVQKGLHNWTDISVKLRNHKEDGDVQVVIVEHPGEWTNWEIEKNSHPFKKKDAGTIEFPVTVKKDGEVKITYTIHRWRQDGNR